MQNGDDASAMQNADEASPSILLAGRALLVKCWRHTLPKLTQDGNTNIEIFKFGSDRENIGSFVRAS